MLKSWNSIFKGSEKLSFEESSAFRENVKKSIFLIGVDGVEMGHEEMYEYLLEKGIPEFDAGEIVIFLPTAFCRRFLPDLNWPTTYFDFYSDKEKKIKRKYKQNPFYLIIEEETEKYWKNRPTKRTVLNIAGRSAEFRAINQLLNKGGKLKDVQLTASVVTRS